MSKNPVAPPANSAYSADFVVTERRDQETGLAHGVMVRVEDAHAHHARAKEDGARILAPPTDYPYGERQYTASIWAATAGFFAIDADVDPSDWGGTPNS